MPYQATGNKQTKLVFALENLWGGQRWFMYLIAPRPAGSGQHASMSCSRPVQLGNVSQRDMICYVERTNAPSLQPEGRTADLSSGFVVKYGQDFLGKANRNHKTLLGSETEGSLDNLKWSKEGREGATGWCSCFA